MVLHIIRRFNFLQSTILFFIILLCCSFFVFSNVRASDNKFNPQISFATYQNYLVLNLQLEFNADLYTYAPSQKDVYPTALKLYSEADLTSQSVQALYDAGVFKADPLNPRVKVRVYDDKQNIFILLPPEIEQFNGELEFSFLACSSVSCAPTTLKVPFKIPHNLELLNNIAWSNDFLSRFNSADNSKLLQPVAIHSFKTASKVNSLPLKIADNSASAISQNNNLEDFSAYDLSNLSLNAGNSSTLQDFSFEPRALNNALEVSSLWKALLFGLIAGFILNFMPCVLPVIALKINFLFKSEQDKIKQIQNVKEYSFFFALGIMLWFLVLGLLLGLLGFSWGQIFQSPGIVLGIMVFIFAMALSLFGVFHLPIININSSMINNPKKSLENKKTSAFITGLFATLLATPCSGPLLGAVLGYSLTQSLPILLTIFLSMGLGMALPYLIFSLYPNLTKFIPTAGNWTNYLEKALGFFLMGTSIYLFSILPINWHTFSLILLLCTALSLFIWGKWGSFHATGLKKILLSILCLIIFVSPLNLFVSNDEEIVFWNNFDLAEFNSSLGRETILLQFSADWCPTCKVLEKTVFATENMKELVEDYDFKAIYVDLTQYDEVKQRLLHSLDSVSIPLVAIFPKGEGASSPIIIRDLYTFNDLIRAFELVKSAPNQ